MEENTDKANTGPNFGKNGEETEVKINEIISNNNTTKQPEKSDQIDETLHNIEYNSTNNITKKSNEAVDNILEKTDGNLRNNETKKNDDESSETKALESPGNDSGFVLSSVFPTSTHDESQPVNKDLILNESSADKKVIDNEPRPRYSVTKQSEIYLTELANDGKTQSMAHNSNESNPRTNPGGRFTPPSSRTSRGRGELRRKGFGSPVQKFTRQLQPLPMDPDPSNPCPINPDIYITTVPKQGGIVKTPFYIHVEIPERCLQGETRIKFEKQDYEKMNMNIQNGTKLCSNIVDISSSPHSFHLRKPATIKMRVLDHCATNRFDQLTILLNRNFTWSYLPTNVVVNVVNDEKHYYAVTDTQCLGKFAVISSCKIDQFVVTQAGGHFSSTVNPMVGLSVEEYALENITPQKIEMKIKGMRQEAVDEIRAKAVAVKGVEGKLIAASPIIEISKHVMGLSGKLHRGINFPQEVNIHVPVPIPINECGYEKRRIKIMHKPQGKLQKGRRHKPNAYGVARTELWQDVTEPNQLVVDGVSGRDEEIIPIRMTIPGQIMVLNYEDGDTIDDDQAYDLSDVCDKLVELNDTYKVQFMIHQKVSHPEILSLHLVTSDAIEPIHNTMSKTKNWSRIFVSDPVKMRERQVINCQICGQLQLAANQVVPNTRFFSQRWQGYQVQLEATEEGYNSYSMRVGGSIVILRKNEDEEMIEMCEANVIIPKSNAKPYKPTVVEKPKPRVTIHREYKLRWLKNLSPAEMERYRQRAGM